MSTLDIRAAAKAAADAARDAVTAQLFACVEDVESSEVDEIDAADFVRALLAGDRWLAEQLVGRIFHGDALVRVELELARAAS